MNEKFFLLNKLFSYFGWGTPPTWVIWSMSFINIFIIVTLAWVFLRIIKSLIKSFQKKLIQNSSHNEEDQKRINTLARVFRYFASIVVWPVAAMLILSELGISIAPILATAGVAGIAVGFGAQSLVKDYFTGLILLIENQIQLGDVIRIGSKEGLVEEVTLRYVRLRDYDGTVHFIPNGSITLVSNLGREHAFAVIEINITYDTDVELIYRLLHNIVNSVRRNPVFADKIWGDWEVAGVETWGPSSILIKGRVKTKPLEQWDVRREILRLLRQEFIAQHVNFAYPRTISESIGSNLKK